MADVVRAGDMKRNVRQIGCLDDNIDQREERKDRDRGRVFDLCLGFADCIAFATRNKLWFVCSQNVRKLRFCNFNRDILVTQGIIGFRELPQAQITRKLWSYQKLELHSVIHET